MRSERQAREHVYHGDAVLNVFDQRRYLIPFRSLLLPHIFTDTLVIGGGVAGARAAIEASRHGSVIVVCKDKLEVSSTAAAQGGISAVVTEDDSLDEHVEDTLKAGAGLCDEPAVRVAVEGAPAEIERLIQWGMQFDRHADGSLALGREGGHGRSRILHSKGDATGWELARCLTERLRSCESLRVFEQCFALDLLTAPGNGRSDSRVLGAITHHPRYGLQLIWANATILAAGGAGQVYRETTNPKVATGDGLAMAFRAGAVIADVEFMQFHPTTLYIAGATRALITEAVRGEGAYLVDRSGRRFMHEYHAQAELAPRDIVSRSIIAQIARSDEPCVYLDVRHLDQSMFRTRFPGLVKLLRSFDLDPKVALIPVRPCAHYSIGGAWTDLDGRTSLPGLYACGECACNGFHGANRLASNSLLDGLVFGQRAGAAAQEMMKSSNGPANIISDIRIADSGELDIHDVRSSLRSAMWRNVGIERVGSKLNDAVQMFDFWGRYTLDKIFDEPNGWVTQNMITVAALMTRAAAWRNETRGVHWRLDYPQTDPALASHAMWTVGSEQPTLQPVVSTLGANA